MQIYKSGIIVRDLVPARYGDLLGFYDEVEHNFIKSEDIIVPGPIINS